MFGDGGGGFEVPIDNQEERATAETNGEVIFRRRALRRVDGHKPSESRTPGQPIAECESARLGLDD